MFTPLTLVLTPSDKLKKHTEEQSVKGQVEAGMETVLKVLVRIDENSKLLRKNLENKTSSSSKDRRTSSRAGRRRSDSESDAKESTRRRSRSSSNDVTVVSVQSSVDKKGRKKKKSGKKRSRSSSTSSVENDTKRIGVFDEKVRTCSLLCSAQVSLDIFRVTFAKEIEPPSKFKTHV